LRRLVESANLQPTFKVGEIRHAGRLTPAELTDLDTDIEIQQRQW
jgi:hypothetical protein